jgi:DNA-binding MarR family transcriptional regulator
MTSISTGSALPSVGNEQAIERSMNAVRSIVRALRINTRAIESQMGISLAQLFVLQQLADRPANSLNELAERTATHQSSVSVVVRRLVDNGYVSRTTSATTNGGSRSTSLRRDAACSLTRRRPFSSNS